MAKTITRFLPLLLLAIVFSSLTACNYDFVLAPNQGLPLDPLIIGTWESPATPGDKIVVSRASKVEYKVALVSNDSTTYFRAYPVKMGPRKLIQLTQEGKSEKPNDVITYSFKGNKLYVGILKDEATSRAELQQIVIANAADSYSKLDEYSRVINPKSNQTAAKSVKSNNSTLPASAEKLIVVYPPETLNTSGLHYDAVVDSIYSGYFGNISLKRESSAFGILYTAYLNSYAQYCSGSLPSDKVEMTERKCATERVTRNGYGTEISRTCVDWVNVGTGLYADPKMYEAKRTLDGFRAYDGIKMLGDLFTDPGKLIEDAFDTAFNAIDASSDMNKLMQANQCSSAGLRTFQENLRSYALGLRANTKVDAAGNSGPRTGYRWKNPDGSRDYRIELLPGIVSPSYGNIRPASGYRWVNPSDPNDVRVELIPGLISTAKGFRPDTGFKWIKPTDSTDFTVQRIK